jgi:ABC-type enterochelin transport system permease subunit
MGLARKRRTPLRAILSLALLAILATATTACGPDQFIPITTGTYPITFTATGTSQGTSTAITHTLTINAIITP